MSPANKLALALAVLATVLISATCVSGKAHSANLIELAQVLAPRTDEAAGSGGDSDRPLRTRITADLLIPGRGEPFEPGVVLVEVSSAPSTPGPALPELGTGGNAESWHVVWAVYGITECVCRILHWHYPSGSR